MAKPRQTKWASTVLCQMDRPALLLTDGQEGTFDCDDSLPPLPVPSLDVTLQKYLDSVKPHLTNEELQRTEDVVRRFASGEGRMLHKKFEEYCQGKRNWLDQWWLEKAYLELRMPLTPLINIAGPGPYHLSGGALAAGPGKQLPNGAFIIHANLVFWLTLRKQEMKIDRNAKGQPFTMYQYRNIFNAYQRPGLTMDEVLLNFKPESEGSCPTHITISCRGRIFTFDILDESGELLTPLELEQQFRHIRERCDSEPLKPALGPLTTEARPTWYKLRNHLIEIHPDNVKHLEEIEQGVLHVALDECLPGDIHELLKNGMAGDSINRWADKAVTTIIFKDGTCSSNCTHTPFDGMVFVYATFFCDMMLKSCGGKWPGSQTVREFPPPRELDFVTDSTIETAIVTAKQKYDAMADDLEVIVPDFEVYGKRWIRSHKIHPDAHMQLALQLAYYRLHGKPAPVYETATLRQFYKGRTETCRSCTMEALDWMKAMVDPSAKDIDRRRLLSAAYNKHISTMLEATQMKGCDRHLLGLSIVAQESGIPTPEIFTDPAFTKSGGGGNFVLSTSFVGYTHCHGGCAPMLPHGYGAFYCIPQDRIRFIMSAWKSHSDTSARKFYTSVSDTLKDMQKLIEATANAPKL